MKKKPSKEQEKISTAQQRKSKLEQNAIQKEDDTVHSEKMRYEHADEIYE